MFYWGDYLAIAIALFIGGFLFGWTACAFSELKEKDMKK
jgi:hypothetical protein